MREVVFFETDEALITKNWKCAECLQQCLCTRRRSRVEVLVSTFNQEKTVVDALDSIAKQTISDSELSVFVNDDCSTDRTVEVAIDFLSRTNISFTVSKSKSNRFSVCGFSFFIDAVFECRSEFLAFLDGDDQWTIHNKLEIQLLELDNNSSAVLCHTAYEVYDGAKSSLQPDHSIPVEKLGSRGLLRKENFVGTLTAVLKTSSLKFRPSQASIKGLPIGDYPIWLIATAAPTSSLAYVGEVTSRYNIHEGNYWATGGMLRKLRRARKAQKFVSRAIGESVGESIFTFTIRVFFRRLKTSLR